VDFSAGGDLVALGLGWEYLDHEAMYELRKRHGVRIHMPAFDLIGVDMPQFNAPQRHLVHRYYAEMAHYADSVTCISQSTLQAMSAFYAREDLTAPALFANPLPGIPPSAQMREVWPRAPFDREPFVLTVSTVEIRKNHLLLAKLWAELIREGREVPHLVLVGRVGWDADELLRWLQLAPELQDRVFLLADVDDAELLALYDRCEFTVFPSRVEGWGLPITESLMRSKVCVHSTDPAQLEASQGIMPALHPDDFMAWKGEVLRLIDDPGYRAALTERITADYVARTPDEYCAEYERILRSRIDGSGST
jgi:glycosyltransferase involved in cell wall biosynthesis